MPAAVRSEEDLAGGYGLDQVVKKPPFRHYDPDHRILTEAVIGMEVVVCVKHLETSRARRM